MNRMRRQRGIEQIKQLSDADLMHQIEEAQAKLTALRNIIPKELGISKNTKSNRRLRYLNQIKMLKIEAIRRGAILNEGNVPEYVAKHSMKKVFRESKIS